VDDPEAHFSRFGSFELNLRTCELFRKGTRVALQGQPARILVALVEADGRVVTREEIRALAWPDEEYGDFEASLNTAIKKIRQALGDSPQTPKFVQTVHRTGYRFLAPIHRPTERPAAIKEPPTPPPPASPPLPEVPVDRQRSRTRMVAMAIAAVAVFALAVYLYLSRATPHTLESVAVLPFTTSEPDMEFLGDGIADEIIDYLARSTDARVISRSSSFQYKGRTPDPRQVGQQLGVQAILTGRIVRRQNDIAIESELADARTGARLWASSYQEPLSERLSSAVHEEVGRQISREVRLKIVGRERTTTALDAVHNADARNLYLRAKFHRNRRSPADNAAAIDELKQAIAIEPSYAAAWAALADCYGYQQRSPTDNFELTQEAVRKAIQFEPDLPEAHAVLGR